MIDAASRGYWVEQYRRQEFAFDSQAVRPYFPYAAVEAGVLQTAAKLVKIEFRKSGGSAKCLTLRLDDGPAAGTAAATA